MIGKPFRHQMQSIHSFTHTRMNTCNIIFFCRKGIGFILFDQILFHIMTAHCISAHRRNGWYGSVGSKRKTWRHYGQGHRHWRTRSQSIESVDTQRIATCYRLNRRRNVAHIQHKRRFGISKRCYCRRSGYIFERSRGVSCKRGEQDGESQLWIMS